MTIFDAISLMVGVIGTAIAIYQCASLNANKEKLSEVQFLLAGINNSAVMKQIAWKNQLQFHGNPTDEKDKEIFRIHKRACDDFAEVANLVSALEGAITPHSSAINAVMEKALAHAKLNNSLQAEGLKNPTLPASKLTNQTDTFLE